MLEIMLGRFIAAMLAVFLIVMMPLKEKGITEAKRCENIVRFLLDNFFQDIEKSGRTRLDDVQELRQKLSNLGSGFNLEIEIGTVVYYQGESTIDVSYTEEVFRELEADPISGIDLRDKLVTVYVVWGMERLEVKIANLFWNSYIPEKVIMTGGYIRG